MRSSRTVRKNQTAEYLVIVCILFVKIWCGFLNQSVLFALGGATSGIIDLFLLGYVFLNSKRMKCDLDKSSAQYKFLLAFLFFAIVYSLLFVIGGEAVSSVSFFGLFPIPKMIYNMISAVIYLCPLLYVVNNIDYKERQILSNLVFIIFFSVALVNLIATIINPELVKNEAYNEDTSLFTLGYSGSYNLMLFTPILLYKLSLTKRKFLFVGFIICNLISVFYGGYFIAILGTFISLLMYGILNIRNKLLVWLFGFILVISTVLLIISGTLEDIMWYLADNINIEVISGRCRDIAKYLSGDTGVTTADTTFRFFIYQDTFSHFLDHPILGNYIFGVYDCMWDHSTILDLLSVGGIMLGGLFVAFIVFGYRFACTFMKNERAKRALLASLIAYLFVAMINSVLSYKLFGILFVVAPIVMGGTEKNEDTDTPSL